MKFKTAKTTSYVQSCLIKCDRACENRACGLKYTMSFDETFLNVEMQYLDSVSSAVKPNKLSTNLGNLVAVSYWNKSYESQKFEK